MIKLEFKPQDAWIGFFWRSTAERFDLWICLLPFFPIHFWKEHKWVNIPNTLPSLEDRHKTARSTLYPKDGWSRNGNDLIREDQ